MRASTWAYMAAEAVASFRRNRFMTLASVTTVMLCLTVLAGMYAVTCNVNKLIQVTEAQVEIRAYLSPNLDSKGLKALQDQLKQIEGIQSFTYISKEQALEQMKQQFGDRKGLLEGIEKVNPLPASFQIKVTDPAVLGLVAEKVKALSGVDEVDYQKDLVDKLVAVTRGLKVASTVLIAALGTVTVLVISNTIRLTVYARRKEIAIMKLVGATDTLIRVPLVLEGMLLGLLGGLAAGICTSLVYGYVFNLVVSSMPFIPLVSPGALWAKLLWLTLAAGGAIGVTGSALSIKRFLQV
ncbi:MAG: permease-like cell division protein FtsX [Bacillota bacterium]